MSDERELDYWQRVRERARELNSNGCSGVPNFHVECCYEHDIAYVTGATIDGEPLTRAEADRRFRLCLQSRSWLGVLSPMSWWRWLAVRTFGRGVWGRRQGQVRGRRGAWS